MSAPRIVPVPQAKELLGGIGTTKFYELMNNRQITRVKIGARTFITTESIDSYLDRLNEVAGAGVA